MYSSISAGAVELLVDVVDPLHQLLDGADDRARVDADRAVLGGRLDDQRERDVVGVVELAPVGGREEGRPDAVEGEDLLGERLVLRQVERVGPGARVGASEQVEVRGDVHVLGVVAGVGLGQVEEQVGIGRASAMSDWSRPSRSW